MPIPTVVRAQQGLHLNIGILVLVLGLRVSCMSVGSSYSSNQRRSFIVNGSWLPGAKGEARAASVGQVRIAASHSNLAAAPVVLSFGRSSRIRHFTSAMAGLTLVLMQNQKRNTGQVTGTHCT
jgi:hypothetical protein